MTQRERSTGRKLLRIAVLTASLGALALAPGTATRAAGPSAPAATWNIVSPLPLDTGALRRRGCGRPALFRVPLRRLLERIGLGRGHRLPLELGQRALGGAGADGRRGRGRLGGLHPLGDGSPRLRLRRGRWVDRFQQRDQDLRRLRELLEHRSGPACRAFVHGLGLQRGERQDLPGRRTEQPDVRAETRRGSTTPARTRS